MTDPTRRFSNRVQDYVKFRPRYPAEVLAALREICGLSAASVVADIGSGTGILTELFLRHGNEVYGVEPNREMREAGERLLAGFARFHSVDARAEATGLGDASVDLVAAGQAFHWFDPDKARAEFRRILKPGGWTALIWNERKESGTPFLEDFEALLRRYGTDYAEVSRARVGTAAIARFFGAGGCATRTFANAQEFDLAGLRGRLLSSSYAPAAGHPDHEPMLAELERVFRARRTGGRVTMEYETTVRCGRPGAA